MSKPHRVRIVTAAEVDAEHVRERRAMLASGIRCNFKGRNADSVKWQIDFEGMAKEAKTGKIEGSPKLVPRRHGRT